VTVDLRVLQLLCSRLCHELISPVTAINNGVELLEGSDEDGAREIKDLLVKSARQGADRLAFYRIAYGLGGDGAKAFTLHEIGALARGVVESGRVRLDWPEGHAGEARFGGAAVKLLLNLVVLAAEALPRGGTLAVRIGAGEDIEITVEARGENARLSPEIETALAAGVDVGALTPRSAHAYFTRVLAETARARWAVQATAPNAIGFTVAVPATV